MKSYYLFGPCHTIKMNVLFKILEWEWSISHLTGILFIESSPLPVTIIPPVYFDMDKKVTKHQSSYMSGTLIFCRFLSQIRSTKKGFQAQTSTTYQFKTFLIGNTFSVI